MSASVAKTSPRHRWLLAGLEAIEIGGLIVAQTLSASAVRSLSLNPVFRDTEELAWYVIVGGHEAVVIVLGWSAIVHAAMFLTDEWSGRTFRAVRRATLYAQTWLVLGIMAVCHWKLTIWLSVGYNGGLTAPPLVPVVWAAALVLSMLPALIPAWRAASRLPALRTWRRLMRRDRVPPFADPDDSHRADTPPPPDR